MVIEKTAPLPAITPYKRLIHSSNEPMLLIEQGNLADANIAAKDILELEETIRLNKLKPWVFAPRVQACGNSSVAKSRRLSEKAIDTGSCKFSWRVRLLNGDEKDISVHLISLEQVNSNLFLCLISKPTVEYFTPYEQAFDTALSLINDAVMLTDNKNRIYYVNPAFERITGYHFNEAYQQPAGFMKSGIHDQDFYQQLWQSLEDTGTWQGEIWDKHKQGHLYPKQVTISKFNPSFGDEEHHLAVFTDCDEKLKFQKQLIQLAYYDDLTQLPNRKLLMDTLHKRINQSRVLPKSMPFWIGYFDIDDFKVINDSKGHCFGDVVIKEVLSLIASVFNENDMVGRMGGDEFLVIFQTHKALKEIHAKLDALFNRLNHPILNNGEQYQVRLSGGLCQYPNHGETSESLLANVDMAMYQAKKQHGNHVVVFEPLLGHKHARASHIELSLITAINEQKIIPHFQPKIDIKTGRLIGFESLARWQQDETFISPTEFIPIAEKSGVIGELSLSLAKQGFSMLKQFQQRGQFSLAINISANELLNHAFPLQLLNLVQGYRLSTNLIEIEITESCLIESFNQVRAQLTILRKMGFKIVLDDFGTGYSSLNYLKEFTFDTIKIDRSFINQLENERKTDFILLNSIIELAHKLGANVVAEGVEKTAQQAYLKDFQCDYAQGFLYAKPMSFTETMQYIRHHHLFFKNNKNK